MVNRYAVFLRGVNVGGKALLKMEMLKKSLGDAGFMNVKTYINSGNIVLSTTGSKNTARQQITKIIKDKFDIETEAFLKTVSELQTILARDPFDPEKESVTSKRVVFLLSEIPDTDKSDKMAKNPLIIEQIYRSGEVMYVYYPNGSGKSRFNINFVERQLKLKATARNWNTIEKIAGLIVS